MEQRLNYVTIAVRDLSRSRRFYVDGLGWEAQLEVPGEVVFIPVGQGLVLSLWNRAEFEEEVGEPADGMPPLTLAHNVSSPEEVDETLASVRAAGATDVVPGSKRSWGGYTGYFADPDGFRWEVAFNPSDDAMAAVENSRRWLAARDTAESQQAAVSEDAVSEEQVARELREREPLFHREPRDSRREHFEAMTTDDLVHVGASGRRLGRTEVLDAVTARYESGEHGDDASWTVNEFEVSPLGGETWLVTYLLSQGRRLSRRSTVWVRDAGGWKARHHQGTVIEQE